MSLPESSLDALLSQVQGELALKRRDLGAVLGPLEQALESYRRALEEEAAVLYASSHNLPRPKGAGVSPQVAARNLLAAVERVARHHGVRSGVEEWSGAGSVGEAQSTEESAGAMASEAAPRASDASGADESRLARSLAEALPHVSAACDSKKLAIVGALAGRRRELPDPLDRAVEWIDTAEGGVHAAGNLPTRIRQGRLFALIICDQAISHKHAEPLVAAARQVGIPIGFAGKGGGASIGRALKAIEEQLAAS